jgi:hypothetical protein
VRRSALNSCRGLIHGVALGGILTPASMSLAQAAERLHDFLRPLTGSGLTHTNRSPKFPVHFTRRSEAGRDQDRRCPAAEVSVRNEGS